MLKVAITTHILTILKLLYCLMLSHIFNINFNHLNCKKLLVITKHALIYCEIIRSRGLL